MLRATLSVIIQLLCWVDCFVDEVLIVYCGGSVLIIVCNDFGRGGGPVVFMWPLKGGRSSGLGKVRLG